MPDPFTSALFVLAFSAYASFLPMYIFYREIKELYPLGAVNVVLNFIKFSIILLPKFFDFPPQSEILVKWGGYLFLSALFSSLVVYLIFRQIHASAIVGKEPR